MAITREQLERYAELNAKRKKLNREVATIEKEEKAIAAEIKAEAHKKGGSFTRFGFRCILTPRSGQPKWQDEFISRLGSDAAAKIKAATPPQHLLQVHSPTA